MAHEILLNAGDGIDEDALQTAFAALDGGLIEQDALGIQYFDSDDTIDTTPALVRVPNGSQQIPLFVDAITGYSLEASAVNSVWLAVDPGAATDDEAVGLVHNTTGVAPSDPSLLIAEADTNQSGDAAVTLRNRGTASGIEGADINPRSIGQGEPALDIAAKTVSATDSLKANGAAVQSSLDGVVVPVAGGLDVGDAIDPAATDTPIQDAIDAIDAANSGIWGPAAGAGGILLPAGTVESPGNLRSLGGKKMVGWGIHASAIEITDPAADGILAKRAIDGAGTWLDGFGVVGGGSRSGSAIHFQDAGKPDCFRFDVGNIQIADWQSSDPVIHFEDYSPFSSNWGSVNGRRFVSPPFLKSTKGAQIRGLTVDNMFIGADAPDTPVIDIQTDLIDAEFGDINIGGRAARGLLVDGYESPQGSLRIGEIAVEPNNEQTISGGVVELRGTTQVSIDKVAAIGHLTADYGVDLADSQMFNAGPGNNRIGGTKPSGNSAFTSGRIGVTGAPRSPSYYWGPGHHIDYNGYTSRGVIPLAETVSTNGVVTDSVIGKTNGTTDTAGEVARLDVRNTNGNKWAARIGAYCSAGDQSSGGEFIVTKGRTQAVATNTTTEYTSNGQYITAPDVSYDYSGGYIVVSQTAAAASGGTSEWNVWAEHYGDGGARFV